MRKTAPAVLAFISLSAISATSFGESDKRMVLAPEGDPYLPYLADPHRAGFEYLAMAVSDVDIPQSGDSRYGLKLGGRAGIVRHGSRERSDEGWQIGLEMGFVGEFDLDYSYDNIGWDGIYGVLFTSALSRDLRLKLGSMHRSSHVGDEYMERTGRRRINYTRQEWIAGLAWHFAPAWRAYGELGHAYDMRNDELQAPGRAQAGLEYVPARRSWNGQLGWFAAVDVSAMEERDWQADVALRAGQVFDPGGRRWLFSLLLYRGRPTMGEFFQHTETYSGFSVMMEL